ncbi:uncharacterized protein ACA1_245720, partial [Acanthamoeba castellanii str. Neff]
MDEGAVGMLGSPTDASALDSSQSLEDTTQETLPSHESPKSVEFEDETLQFEHHEQQEEQEDPRPHTETEGEDMHVVGRALHSAANDVAATSPRYELARGIDERTFDGNPEDHNTNHDLSAALYSSSPSSLSSSAPTTTSSQGGWGWSSLSRSMNFVPTRFYSSNTTGHDRPEDEQTALDAEQALTSKLSSATHLVVLAHGLHGGVGDLVRVAGVLTATYGDTLAVLIAKSNHGFLATHEGVDVGGERLGK